MDADSEQVPPKRTLAVRILLVDADPSASESVDAALRDRYVGYHLAVATSVANGLDRIAGEAWDVCLVEQALPDGDGLDLIRTARARGAATPFILLTAAATDELDERAMHAGASDCVERPFADQRLVRAIRYAIGGHREFEARFAREATLRHDEKMEALGRLAGGVAHEVNNVLTAIMGYADLVADQTDPGAQARRDVDEIRRAAERAAAFMRKLSLLSDSQAMDSVELDVNETLSGCLETMSVKEPVQVTHRLGSGLAPVRGDVVQLAQALNHVIANALEAMPTGGTLTVETSTVTVDQAIRRPGSPAVQPGSYVMARVSDTGAGMDADTCARAFEPFFTTKRKGHGLGLPIAHGLVSRNGGAIVLESAPGLGTTVSLYLQAARIETETGEEPAPSR
jgi:signal transduction histidine kinase